MIAELFRTLCQFNPGFKKLLWKRWYEFQANYYPKTDWSFMNYGYAPLDADPAELPLLPEDEANRYSIQLYHYVATLLGAVSSLKGLHVLEVGSGRGGGCAYIKRYLNPDSITGVDFSSSTVTFCNLNFSSSNLIFIAGDAEALPFVDNSFDLVINVESSHCYRSMEAFVGQVKRILKKGGRFICADLRRANELGLFQHCIRNSGMSLLEEVDITANVFKALSLDHDRKLAQIQKSAPKPLINAFKEYSGLKGSKIYNWFRTREVRYFCFMLEKNEF